MHFEVVYFIEYYRFLFIVFLFRFFFYHPINPFKFLFNLGLLRNVFRIKFYYHEKPISSGVYIDLNANLKCLCNPISNGRAISHQFLILLLKVFFSSPPFQIYSYTSKNIHHFLSLTSYAKSTCKSRTRETEDCLCPKNFLFNFVILHSEPNANSMHFLVVHGSM